MRSWIMAGVLALGLSSAAGLTGPTTAYAQNLNASVGYYPGALISLPALVASDQKFFEKNGLTVELVPITTGPAMTAAVSSGSVTFVNNSYDNLLTSVEKGLPVRGVAGSTAKVPFALIARKGLELPHAKEGYPAVIKDLVGKNWGVLALGVSVHFMEQALLTDAGFKATDATFLAIGLPNTARPALQRGTADVYLSIEPLPSIFAAKGEGTVILDLGANQGPKVFNDLNYNGWWASTTTIKDKPDVVARFAKALEDSYCWYSNPNNLDQVVTIMQHYAAVPELSLEQYKDMVKRLIPTFGPEITSRTIDTWSQLLVDHQQLTAPKKRSDVIAASARESFFVPEIAATGTTGTIADRESANGTAHISARGVAVNFGGTREALSGVNLEVAKGEFVALIGASGCGKTTLLNVVAGLVPASRGTVTVGKRPPAAGRNDICYILARDALLPWRSVQGNVEYGLELSHVGREERARRAASYIEKVGLQSYREFYPSRLSQGMRQRVSLARAFAVERQIYLMDEPFSALNSQTKLVLHDQLLGLWETSGATVVFVTHDIGEAITLADRVVVMSKRGTGVAEEIRIDLPRPRSAEALQADARYHDLYRRTWTCLKASTE